MPPVARTRDVPHEDRARLRALQLLQVAQPQRHRALAVLPDQLRAHARTCGQHHHPDAQRPPHPLTCCSHQLHMCNALQPPTYVATHPGQLSALHEGTSDQGMVRGTQGGMCT